MGEARPQKLIEVAIEMAPEEAISLQFIARNPQQIMPMLRRTNQFRLKMPVEDRRQGGTCRLRDMEEIERYLSLFTELG